MYSIKDVANRLGVSTVAVYKRVNRPSFESYIIIQDDRKYITEEGFEKLKETSMNNSNIDNSNKQKDFLENRNLSNVENPVMIELVNMLKKQLEVKDKQLETVTELFKETKSELIRLNEQMNSTYNELAGLLQIKEKGSLLIEAKKYDNEVENNSNKSSLWNKLFGKKKHE